MATTFSNADPGYIPAPPKANASTKVTNSTLASLMSTLNASEKRLCTAANGKESMFDVPNTYSIEFAPESLGDSTLAIQGKSKAATPMAAKTGNNTLDQNRQQIDYTVRNYSFAAGTPIVTIIDEIVKNSSYITNQARAVIDENTQEIKEQPPLGNMAWYKISTQATPKEPYDKKRKGYAYDIEYIVSAYAINSMDSEFFDQAVKRGVHKSYKYWFTGQNTQVLRFEQKFNSVYLTTMTLPESLSTWRQKTKNVLAPREYQAAVAGSSSQGAQRKTNSVGASAADYLYSVSDIGEASITIIGDPAWLQQGETVAGINSKNFNFNPFEPDGTINYDAQQIVFDIQYNTPVDYDAEGTGLANPNVDTAPQAIYTYITKTVKSRFSKGKFEQDIDGVLFQDPFSVKASSGAGGGTIDGDANGNDSDWTDDGTDGGRGTDPATIGGGRGGIGGPTAEELAINNAAVARVSMNNLAATEAYNASNDFSGFDETGSSPNTTSILPFTAAEPDVNTALNASDPEGQAYVPDFTPSPPKLKPSVTQDVNSAVNAADPEAQVFNNQLMAKDK